MGEETKRCPQCKDTKSLSEFYVTKSGPNKGKPYGWCKDCTRAKQRWFRQNHPEKVRRYKLNKSEQTRLNELAGKRRDYQKNKQRYNKLSKENYEQNKARYLKQSKQWKKENREHYNRLNRERNKRPEVRKRVLEQRAAYYREYKQRPGHLLRSAISTGIYRALCSNKNGRRWEQLVGYTLSELKAHLEKQFVDGMSWDNYGRSKDGTRTWHIDHIIPVSAFNFETPEDLDFKRCWALENLQPLWAKDNLSKGAKLDSPFQPSLQLRLPDET